MALGCLREDRRDHFGHQLRAGGSEALDDFARELDDVAGEKGTVATRAGKDRLAPDFGRVCASIMTEVTPNGSASVATFSPRSRSERRSSVQTSVVSAPPSAIPRTSRRPSPFEGTPGVGVILASQVKVPPAMTISAWESDTETWCALFAWRISA